MSIIHFSQIDVISIRKAMEDSIKKYRRYDTDAYDGLADTYQEILDKLDQVNELNGKSKESK